MFKQTILAVALLAATSVSSATELNNNTAPAAPESFTVLAEALRENNIDFLGTAETGGTLFVFIDQHTGAVADFICTVAHQAVDGKVFLFKRSAGIVRECM